MTDKSHLWLMPSKSGIAAIPIEEPMPDGRSFMSDDPDQLVEWLRAGRGPICTKNPLLIEQVRRLYG